MGEVDWIPGVVVALIGVVGGVLLALRAGARAAAAPSPPVSERRADLLARKAALYEQLRDLDDMGERRPEAATERAVLERRAADVLKALAASGDPEPAPVPAAEAPPPPPPSPSGGLPPELRGGLIGAAVVGLLAVTIWGLQNYAGERPEGGIATGGDFLPWGTTDGAAAPEGATPAPGRAGGAVPGVPPSLQPKPSPAVDAARAMVGANPGSVEAHVQLGWALLDAEGWIDAYQTAETVLRMDPTSPDGRVISAAVRIVMGMETVARELIDEALSYDPKHIQALSYSGMLHWRAGDRAAAEAAWTTAKAAGGDPASFDRLIAMAQNAPLPGKGPAPHPDGDPHAAGSEVISGTLSLGPNAKPPAGGRIFVIARRPGVAGGPPAATAMLPAKLPTTFRIGQANVMMGGPFPDEVELTVRWDADGDAMTKGDDDLWGTADSAVAKGTSGVAIVLH